MAKRGRPTVENREKELFFEPETERLLIQMFTNGTSKRSMTNAFYSYIAFTLFLEDASKIPEKYPIEFWDEIAYKNCITEQLGRMYVQDHYGLLSLFKVARIAAKAYLDGYTAKEIAAYIKNVRKTGHL